MFLFKPPLLTEKSWWSETIRPPHLLLNLLKLWVICRILSLISLIFESYHLRSIYYWSWLMTTEICLQFSACSSHLLSVGQIILYFPLLFWYFRGGSRLPSVNTDQIRRRRWRVAGAPEEGAQNPRERVWFWEWRSNDNPEENFVLPR